MESPSTSIGRRLLMSLSYLSVLFLIPLVLVDENDTYGGFHVRHGFMLFILTIVGNVVLLILDVPAQGYLYPYAGRLFNLIIVGFCAYGIISALRGRADSMWVVTRLLDKFMI